MRLGRTSKQGKADAHEVLRIFSGYPEGARKWRIYVFRYTFS